MATLTNNISAQNIVDRFADYVVATANTGIVYGTNSYPFGGFSGYFPNIFGGSTAGKAIGINAASLGGAGSTIDAANIISVLRAETTAYTSIRNMRSILNITGVVAVATRLDAGPITGYNPGFIWDNTSVSYLNSSYLQTLGATTSTGIATGSTIGTANLEAFFTNLQTAYNTARAVVHTEIVSVCHSSCHSNCHSSRGRR